MDEQKTAGQKLKEALKPTKRMAITAIVILILLVLLIVFLYKISGKVFKDLAENGATYGENAIITPTDGIIAYKPDKDGNLTEIKDEELLEGIDNISSYLKDDYKSTKEEKLRYLLNASLVTKFPYIEGLSKDKVNGVVKFYRYNETEHALDENQEKYRLEFVDEETFNKAFEAYQNSGKLEVFKYFTIDEDQQLVIACRTETIETITTDDFSLTAEIINENSGDTYSSAGTGKYATGKNTITKQTKDYQSIIEQYTMPFNLLAAFLVQTGSYDFVKELADMAYESEIKIGIYENKSITTKSDTYTYKKRIEYSENTELDFSVVSTKNPQMTGTSIQSRYGSRIIKSCLTMMSEDQETQNLTVAHQMKLLNGNPAGIEENNILHTKYVQSYDEGTFKISGLSDGGKTFTTTYYTRTESRTSLTIGTIVADTWVARWEATYVAEQNEPTPGPTSEPPSDSERTITQDGTSLFVGSAKTEVDGVLTQHSNKIKDDAVNTITSNVSDSEYTVSQPTITADIIRAVANVCEECKTELDSAIAGWKEEYNNDWLVEAVNTLENLSHTREHVNSYIQGAIIGERSRKKQEFKNELNNEIIVKQYPTVAISNVNIEVSPSYSKDSVTHKQGDVIRTKDGEKFKELFNDSKYHSSKQAILERTQWFWEYIREYDDTAKLENVLRYLFNIATGTNQFGNFSEEDIENLFNVFEPKELMKSATISGLQLLRQYIDAWENQTLLNYINGEIGYTEYVAQYIEIKDGKQYYKIYDVGGNPTVGFGIDLITGAYYDEERQQEISFTTALVEDYGFTKEQLIEKYENTLIEVEIIDDLKEKRIMQDYNYLVNKSETYGLELTNYQIYALTSRRYNSWIDDIEFEEFVEVYTKYYNFETDDKYGESYTDEDFEHKLYTEHMDEPINQGTKEEEGLRKRRKSEWILFLTGYMDRLDRFVPENSIIDCAEIIHAYMEENEYTYCVYYTEGNTYEECAAPSLCGLNTTFEKSKTGYHHTCCATFVSWVLQEAGYLTEPEHTDSAGTMKDTLVSKGWQQIGSIEDAEPGDILYYSYGHVEIYAGDGTVYNAGSGSAIRNPAPAEKTSISNADMILRAP